MMKKLLTTTTLLLLNSLAIADGPSSENQWDPSRPDSHASITVMGEHTHSAGEFMLSYRYMHMKMDGYLQGSDSRSSQDLFNQGYMVAPTEMEMEMHMLGGMYAPTDWATLMIMTNYQERSMDHVTMPGSMMRMMRGETFTNESDGWGDTSIGGLFKIYDANKQRVHLNLGISLPTGDFNELPYQMQVTTGTYDLRPGITWLWQKGSISGGAQAMGRIHLDDNKHGFSYGDSIESNIWAAYKVSDWVSLSARVAAKHIDEIDGTDNRITALMSPAMDAKNSGGDFIDVGVGANFYIRKGALKGNRIAAELTLPTYQDVNGLQMEKDWMLTLGWQYAF